MKDNLNKITNLWNELYGKQDLVTLKEYLNQEKKVFVKSVKDPLWYQKSVVYSLYVQFFNETFEGLEEKLFYFKELGINCLWLLPILESPMKDAGYDVADYKSVRADLFTEKSLSTQERLSRFQHFVQKAHEYGIQIIFDLVLNHCSSDHPFFQQAKQNDAQYFDYFVWDKHGEKYPETRIIFEGICKSNWEYCKEVDSYYLHRFYPEQPDWNYKNPKVLLYILDTFIFWKKMGVDGFRLDAIPFLWKEEKTNCESLPECHTVIKIIRAVLDYLEPGTLLLAEACQPTSQTVSYFGNDDECHGAYHFPLMPQIFLSLATKQPKHITSILQNTQAIPQNSQWFTFLRCHDELTLEMSTSEEKNILNQYYCRNSKWKFREGSGISARLFDLFAENIDQTKLAFSILLTLPGTPIIYYGDELAMQNDDFFYLWMIEHTGYKDSRNFCRNKVNWSKIEKLLDDHNSPTSLIYKYVQTLIKIRKNKKCFQEHSISFVDMSNTHKQLLAYERKNNEEACLVVHNLGIEQIPYNCSETDIVSDQKITRLMPYQTVIFCKE